MKILIGTPVAGNSCTAIYAGSVFSLAAFVASRRPDIQMFPPRFFSTSLLAHSRNAYANLVLQDQSFTHLLFIDSDMGFRPEAVLRMLDFDKDVVGCLTPGRRRDGGRAFQAAKAARTPAEADILALEFIASAGLIRSEKGYVVERGFVRTSHIGCGLTLIRRGVLERMREAYPALSAPADESYRAYGVEPEVIQVFNALQLEDRRFISEDISFCRRWADLGGEIWACIDEEITHAGFSAPSGRYIDQLRLQSERAASPTV